MDTFKRITLQDWRQFEQVDIDLQSQVTILTGPNGCGKTTLLNVLGRSFGWNINFISSPLIKPSTKRRLWSEFRNRFFHGNENNIPERNRAGAIELSSGQVCTLLVPENLDGPQYQLQYSAVPNIDGISIPSHRPVVTYFPIDNIPTNPKTNQEQHQEFQQLLFQAYGAVKTSNPGQILKRSLISLALFGEGNTNVQPNHEYQELFNRFQEILRLVLPKEIGFRRLQVRMPDVILVTESGNFLLDSMSGGVAAVFGIAWQLTMYGADKGTCTALIDEPENHLHPSMQRELIPSLRRAFPNFRFVIASHSPFIVASDRDASVYALLLSTTPEKRVTSRKLLQKDLASTPNQILKDVLGVPTTLPVWVEDRIRAILTKYDDMPNNEAKAERIFNELKEQGLSQSLDAVDF